MVRESMRVAKDIVFREVLWIEREKRIMKETRGDSVR